MRMLFEPLNSDGHLRSLVYHDARLQMLHDRVIKRFDKVEDAAERVQAAAELLVEAYVRTVPLPSFGATFGPALPVFALEHRGHGVN
ncbi:hypothetical protein SAMN03159463_05308 [Mesorhizobium sp. NFR06]|uniref:hypothetical protein n=1 Tax=Mesorhizobium sp. NFR06 TaxID=1566290 RepID=UPI0008E4A5B2|nr:hypothetical protein [Mesorhizobium sp. NFR06]SFP98221.1 hypothetical protein SAMN03159463_05308 [Mesorhizobium sp. NFR06]